MIQVQMDYDQAVQNLSTFVSSLKTCGIKFLYFEGKQLDKPLVKDVFRKLCIGTYVYYVGEAKDFNYLYLYQESDLKLLIEYLEGPTPHNSMTNSQPASLKAHPVKIVGVDRNGDVNFGDHLTFSLYELRDGDYVFKSHYTQYLEVAKPRGSVVRYPSECNFRASKFRSTSLKNFTQIRCVDIKDKETGKCIGETYEDKRGISNAVYNLCRLSLNKGLDPKNSVNEFIGPKGGCYKCSNNIKTYTKQKGGDNTEFTILTDSFISFLKRTLFQRIVQFHRDAYISLIYDEKNKLGGANNIIIIYDYANDTFRQVFRIDTNHVLAACYADEKQNAGLPLSPIEKTALDTFIASVGEVVVKV